MKKMKREHSTKPDAILKNYLVKIFLIFISSRIYIFIIAEIINRSNEIGRNFTNLLCSSDCGHYGNIFAQGYDSSPYSTEDKDVHGNWSFFPVFPLATKIFAKLTGLDFLMSSFFVTQLAFLLGLVFLYKYTLRFIDKNIAIYTVGLMAFSPYSFYFSVPYSEAIYFLLMISSVWFASTQKWITSGLCGAVLSATRPLGMLTALGILPIIYKYVSKNSFRQVLSRLKMPFVCLSLFPLGISLYTLFLYFHTGDGLAYKHIRIAWRGFHTNEPISTILSGLFQEHDGSYVYFSLLAIFVLFCCGYLIKRRFFTEGLILLSIPIVSIVMNNMPGYPRFVTVLFPLYIALALLVQKHKTLKVCLPIAFVFCNIFTIWAWLNLKWYMI